MYLEKTVAVLIPAYNEEKLIRQVMETLPDWVDHVLVVDDCSRDRTIEKIKEYMQEDGRVRLIQHEKNKGVGGALETGYRACRDAGYDITVVMNGDAQMHPEDLPAIFADDQQVEQVPEPLADGGQHGQRQPVQQPQRPHQKLGGTIREKFLHASFFRAGGAPAGLL